MKGAGFRVEGFGCGVFSCQLTQRCLRVERLECRDSGFLVKVGSCWEQTVRETRGPSSLLVAQTRASNDTFRTCQAEPCEQRFGLRVQFTYMTPYAQIPKYGIAGC